MLAFLGTHELRRRSKVPPYVRYQPCGAGSWLWGSKIDPAEQSSAKSYVLIPTQIHADFGPK
eukprot:5208260-Ditylum_brightwellii.AAC.1